MKEDFFKLIEEKRFDDLENYWLEQMESGQTRVDEFLSVAKALARQKEKERAYLLLGLLADHSLQQQNWSDRFLVLKELARHQHDPDQLERLRDQIRETLLQLYPARPSFEHVLRFFHYQDLKDPEDLRRNLEKIEWWLLHDVGEIFYQSGYGVGRVKEVNLNLGLVRLDFESKKDIAIQYGDYDVVPLKEGHILREKLQEPEKLRQEAMEDPGALLGRLLKAFSHPLNVNEIKECLNEVVPVEQWSRWWTAARKHPQILVSGKGTQATYTWSESSSSVEEALIQTFENADVQTRMELVKQHRNRNRALADYFLGKLAQDAKQAFEEGQGGLALELLDLFGRPPGSEFHPGYSLEDVLRKAEPKALLTSIENPTLKMKVLEAIRQYFPDSWQEIYLHEFLRGENPKILTALFDALQKDFPAEAESAVDSITAHAELYPGTFTWLCQVGIGEDPQVFSDMIRSRINDKLLISLLKVIEEPEFSIFRSRLKKALEEGLLMNILQTSIDAVAAQKTIELLERSRVIEEYRRERWKNTIRMRFPEMKEKQDVIFSTNEALIQKRAELEHLIQVELPKNRKEVGEAARLGDLSENFEYKAARERQDYLINRVSQLQDQLKMVRVLEPDKVDCSRVRPGARVTLIQPDKTMAITILGPWDSNPKEGIYSYEAPVAKAFLGKAPGDRVQWDDQTWIIEKIEPWI